MYALTKMVLKNARKNNFLVFLENNFALIKYNYLNQISVISNINNSVSNVFFYFVDLSIF